MNHTPIPGGGHVNINIYISSIYVRTEEVNRLILFRFFPGVEDLGVVYVFEMVFNAAPDDGVGTSRREHAPQRNDIDYRSEENIQDGGGQ